METYQDKKALLKELRKYQILSEMAGDIVFEYSTTDERITFSESIAERLWKHGSRNGIFDVIYTSPAIFDEDREELAELFRSVSPVNPGFKSELRIKLPGGRCVWYELFVNSLWDIGEGEDVSGAVVGKLVNVDRRKRETDMLRKVADADPLTKLLNKKAFQSRVEGIIKSRDASDSALFFIDLDNFKSINDTFGHQFGDEVLVNTADAIRKTVRVTDIVGRIGGDEFAVFLCGIGEKEHIDYKACHLSRVLSVKHGEHHVSASVGIARFPHDADNYASLLLNADRALYHMKNDGKDGYVFYDKKLDDARFTSQLSEPER
jgi:diguanylate cyclase (GGDEF)-like protein